MLGKPREQVFQFVFCRLIPIGVQAQKSNVSRAHAEELSPRPCLSPSEPCLRHILLNSSPAEPLPARHDNSWMCPDQSEVSGRSCRQSGRFRSTSASWLGHSFERIEKVEFSRRYPLLSSEQGQPPSCFHLATLRTRRCFLVFDLHDELDGFDQGADSLRRRHRIALNRPYDGPQLIGEIGGRSR